MISDELEEKIRALRDELAAMPSPIREGRIAAGELAAAQLEGLKGAEMEQIRRAYRLTHYDRLLEALDEWII